MRLKDVEYRKLDPLQRALYINARRMFLRKPESKTIYVTSLFTPIRQYFLRKRHGREIWENLKLEDLDKFFWALDGSAMHAYLANFKVRHAWQDVKRLTMKVKDYTIVGRPDLYYLRKRKLIDYKKTSVFHQNQIVSDSLYQLNAYRLMLWMQGYSVKSMQLEVIYKDWQESKKLSDSDYPPSFHATLPVPFLNLRKLYNKIYQRVLMFEICQDLDDDLLPYCTPEERWAKADTWAVMKKGQKRAVRVLNSENAAISYGKTIPGAYIEYRAGSSVRCERFCDVAPWCTQYQKEKE